MSYFNILKKIALCQAEMAKVIRHIKIYVLKLIVNCMFNATAWLWIRFTKILTSQFLGNIWRSTKLIKHILWIFWGFQWPLCADFSDVKFIHQPNVFWIVNHKLTQMYFFPKYFISEHFDPCPSYGWSSNFLYIRCWIKHLCMVWRIEGRSGWPHFYQDKILCIFPVISLCF